MKAIRGAITVEADSPEEIRCAVKELLLEIKQQNHLTEADILLYCFPTRQIYILCIPQKQRGKQGLLRLRFFRLPNQ